MKTITPGLALGPQAYSSGVKEAFNFSIELLNSSFVDVRDVVKSHLRAFESVVKDFESLPITDHFSIQTCAAIIEEQFIPLRETYPIGTPSSGKDDHTRYSPWHNKKTMAYLEDPISLE